MNYDEHIVAVERETAALVAALQVGPMQSPVPTCPDWTLRDLACHVGEFTGWWTHVLCEGTGRPKTPYHEAPEDAAIAEWYGDLAGHLVAELTTTPPDAAVWTWVEDDKTARFVARRCANELAVHRFDAQMAVDDAQPVDAGKSLHLHGTDRGDEWIIAMTPTGLDVRRRHGPGDLILSGDVSDLELLLFQRPPLGSIDRGGDLTVLDAWYREFTFG